MPRALAEIETPINGPTGRQMDQSVRLHETMSRHEHQVSDEFSNEKNRRLRNNPRRSRCDVAGRRVV